MSKFKVGDKVRAVANPTSKYYSNAGYFNAGEEFTVEEVFPWQNTVKLVEDDGGWSEERFELVEPVSAATLTTPVVPQLPGIPEGYRAVRVGAPVKGEWYVNVEGRAERGDGYMTAKCYTILEKIDQPAPVEPAKPEASVAPAKKVAPRFKVGDKIKCVTPLYGCTVGKTYEITTESYDLVFKDDDGDERCRSSTEFVPVVESPDDLVIQDRVPAREGIDFGWWVAPERFDSFIPAQNTKWKMPSYHAGKMHGFATDGGDSLLAVTCYRKDLPALPTTERVLFTEYVCWDNTGPKFIWWMDADPTAETDDYSAFHHAYPTGNTREVEVPIVKP